MSIKTILESASNKLLSQKNLGAISYNQVCRILLEVYIERYQNPNIKRKKDPFKLLNSDFINHISNLLDAGVLRKTKSNKIFFLPSYKKYNDIELISQLYNDCYLSFLSAIDWYGFTNIILKNTFITIPNLTKWKEFSSKRINELEKNYLSIHQNEETPLLNLQKYRDEYPNKEISRVFSIPVKIITNSKYSENSYKLLKDENGILKIREVGMLFLDMLNEPQLCGGHQHVIDIYENYGYVNALSIIKAADLYGSTIVKARVGFLLEKFLDINNKTIQKWKMEQSDLRGGSRKLFPDLPFSSYFSEDWNISINFKQLEYIVEKNE